MKGRFLALTLSFAALTGLSGTAVAGPLTPGTITFQATDGVAYGGDYVGIYLGTVNGGPGITDFICDDFDHEISTGESWTATVGSTNPVTPNVRFGPADITNPDLIGQVSTVQQDYNMITYLANQIYADPTNSKGDWGYLSWAIWSINSDSWNSPYYTIQVQAFETDALQHENDDNGDLTVYTPATGQPGQEFLADGPAAPEPPGLVLVGTALALATALLLRSRG